MSRVPSGPDQEPFRQYARVVKTNTSVSKHQLFHSFSAAVTPSPCLRPPSCCLSLLSLSLSCRTQRPTTPLMSCVNWVGPSMCGRWPRPRLRLAHSLPYTLAWVGVTALLSAQSGSCLQRNIKCQLALQSMQQFCARSQSKEKEEEKQAVKRRRVCGLK